jgi:hypothetical protein
LNDLRAAQNDPRGAISELHLDQARAAIVFTAAGIDACLRTLLRDALTTLLLSGDGPAHGAFTRHFMGNRLKGDDNLGIHQDFFDARHEVVHELDLIDFSGKGTRSRRHRDIAVVGQQCGRVLHLLHRFIAPTAVTVKSARKVVSDR